jgi:hypothetical protein
MPRTKNIVKKDERVIEGYTLTSAGKLAVAMNGDGRGFGGVGQNDPYLLLAEYDKRGGAIFKVKDIEDPETGEIKPTLVKLQNGIFYDFKEKRPKTEKEREEGVELKAKTPKARGVTIKKIVDKG